MIEHCSEENQQQWLALRCELWPDDSPEDHQLDIDNLLAEPEQFVQAIFRLSDDQAVGFIEASIRSEYVNGTSTTPIVFLEGIYVKESHRGYGIAKKLLQFITEWALDNGFTELASDALVSNRSAQQFHQGLGFEETERVVFYCKSLLDD
ncbi:aminoglycoside 6'-N-acetyltransferase [Reinekea thalattae]|uniref:Aminoglycoside N(6')-acetyltransferase type 1 n=1 Tax=Reinekea thalattae TaxID=2593301 RepID=A0A5C8ZB42_9GAMM|nr:aminoglycoside 6'-N-acetyltransferase [Reinekea thalattae]TXR54373.1 GNAT family N-acetyltransferase [Reinekea thalattae]